MQGQHNSTKTFDDNEPVMGISTDNSETFGQY
jgi:hypothetical protein